ncbi:MAG: DUF3137 domain-containing protein [Myxococcota bacterium]|nr:DUF3137 domain-containing protein [Myxococcota bacterium]
MDAREVQEIVTTVFVIGISMAVMTLPPILLFAVPQLYVQRWGKAARALGLPLARRDGAYPMFLTMHGQRGGLEVECGVRVEGGGRNDLRRYFTYVSARFPRSLSLHVEVVPTDTLGSLDRWKTENDIQLDDPVLDPTYVVRAGEPDVAQALFRAPEVRDALARHATAPFRAHVFDGAVMLEAKGRQFRPEILSVVIDDAVDLATKIVAARAALGASEVSRAMAEGWRRFAEARGFELDVAGMRMAGRYEGLPVEVKTERRGGERWTWITARIDPPLGMVLALARQGRLAGLARLVGVQDIQLGDAEFDRRFVVKGGPDVLVREALTPPVRRALVALDEAHAALSLEDDRLTVAIPQLITDADALDRSIASAVRAIAPLARGDRAAPAPYRD